MRKALHRMQYPSVQCVIMEGLSVLPQSPVISQKVLVNLLWGHVGN